MIAAAAPANQTLYATSFEASGGYTVGATINGVNDWVLEAGTDDQATIISDGSAEDGLQFLRLTNGATLNRTFAEPGIVNTTDVIWVEGYFRGQGSDSSLTEALNDYQGDASAIVHFSQLDGIEFLDGNGTGGGAAVASAVTSLDANTWYKITIRLNFGGQSWDVWVKPVGGSESSQTGLGFRNANITKLNGFKNLAQTQADFDAFRVVKPIHGDANGDTIVDSADVTALIENLSGEDDVIVRLNGDVDGNGVLEQSDVSALVNLLTQQ